jgi:hypothetical protein
MEQVDDKAFEGDLECLRLKDAIEETNQASAVDKKANMTSLDGQSNVLTIESLLAGDSSSQ